VRMFLNGILSVFGWINHCPDQEEGHQDSGFIEENPP
jgi:hypothetical protein